MEGFAFPDEIRMAKCFIPFVFVNPLFYGKLHTVKLRYGYMVAKKLLLFPFITTTWMLWIKWNPIRLNPKDVPSICKAGMG